MRNYLREMSNSITRKAWLSSAAQALSRVSDSSQLDARLLLCQVLDISKSQLLAWPEQTINTQQQSALQKLIERRLAGEPMAYILGSAEFWGLELMVSPAVLVPRPETELIIEITLETIKEQGLSAPTILDLGTGSGAIALALAAELPDATLLAVDVSESALQVAEANRKRHGLTNVRMIQSNWFERIDPKMTFDFIVSNPPYVAEGDPHLSDLAHEPDLALTAAEEGMADIRHLTITAPKFLKPGGWLIVEHGYNQGDITNEQFMAAHFSNVNSRRDLAQVQRVTLGQWG